MVVPSGKKHGSGGGEGMNLDNRYGAFMTPELKVPPLGQGPLEGLMFTIKDVFAVIGHRSSAGNPDWLRSHIAATQHASAVQKLLLSGASLRGAAHTDEIMYSLGGENYHYGTPMNPRAPGRIPGGSSSGSAVAVASGSVDFALGTDTGGSIRVPSSYCGVYGFRPTHDAVGMEGVIPLSPSFDTVGWIADSAELLHRVGKVLLNSGETKADSDGGDQTKGCILTRSQVTMKPMKSMEQIFVATDAWNLTDQESSIGLSNALGTLQRSVSHCVEIEIAPEGLKSWMDTFRELQGNEIWRTHGEWIEQEHPHFGPDIDARFTWASKRGEAGRIAALWMRAEISSRLHLLLGETGCIVIPTVPGAAPMRGGNSLQLEMDRNGAMMLCCIAGLAGLPQVTLPVMGENGLPLGISVIAGYGQDLRLLSWISEVWV
jgi:amidase